MTAALAWIEKHRGAAAFVGGCASVTLGAAWWLAKGGAAAFVLSLSALSDPHVAAALVDLPAYTARVERSLSAIAESQADLARAVRQVADAQEAYRAETEEIVDWAPEHSQRLTEAVGGCYAGSDCQVFFRGRRTQAGVACVLTSAKPRLILPNGEEFPVEFSSRNQIVQLGKEFETLPVWIKVPDFVPAGAVGLVVMTIYADCPFAAPGQAVARETFRMTVRIKVR